jgi:hypothetical protein
MELGRKQAESDIQARIKDLGMRTGAWSYNETLGSAASNPFDRALLAVTGILGASREQNVYYFAAEDSNGDALRADKVYRISGQELPARWWSITAYDPLYLIANEQNRYSINRTTITTDGDGNWEAYLTSETQEGQNWIHSGGGDTDLLLALRLYNPSAEFLIDMGAVPLPEILPIIEQTTEEAHETTVSPESDTQKPDAPEDKDVPEADDTPASGAEADADSEGDEADE